MFFISAHWTALPKQEDLKEKFDLIVMAEILSETLYNTEYYESLLETIRHCLKPDGRILCATKTLYYGLGGGLYEWQAFIAGKGL